MDDVTLQIKLERQAGRVTCRRFDSGFDDVVELAKKCSLVADAEVYLEIERDDALALARDLLTFDLLERDQLMEPERADELVAGLFDGFREAHQEARFFTNGTFVEAVAGRIDWEDVAWAPATLADADTGVLALGADGAAALWVEEEG